MLCSASLKLEIRTDQRNRKAELNTDHRHLSFIYLFAITIHYFKGSECEGVI